MDRSEEARRNGFNHHADSTFAGGGEANIFSIQNHPHLVSMMYKPGSPIFDTKLNHYKHIFHR